MFANRQSRRAHTKRSAARRVRAHRPLLETLEDRHLLAAGGLDPTFGLGGLVTTDLHGDLDQGNATALQPDGKIVVAGTTDIGAGGPDLAVGLVRYNTNGTRDSGFGVNGVVTTDLFDPGDEEVTDVVIQADGKIVVAGSALHADGHRQLALIRYRADGTLDPSFGANGNGVVFQNLGVEDRAVAVDLQSDGKIIVLGHETDAFGTSVILLARFTTDGGLDPTFGNVAFSPGLVRFGFNAGSIPNDVVVGPIGIGVHNRDFIVVAGTQQAANGQQAVLARFDPNGARDTSFGQGLAAVAATNFGGLNALAVEAIIQPDFRILLAGQVFSGPNTNQDFAVARFDVDGTLDLGFSSNVLDRGYVVVDLGSTGFVPRFDEAFGVRLQPDDKILLAGRTLEASDADPNPNVDFAVVRLTPAGALDATFGTGGRVITDVAPASASHDTAQSVLVQPDGRIIVAGSSGSDFGVARYLGDAGIPPVADADGDGVLDVIENGHPNKVPGTNDGDGDGDGTPDRQQGEVASLPNAVDGVYLTLSVLAGAAGTAFKKVRTASTPAPAPRDASLPIGLVEFDVVNPGVSVAVDIRLAVSATVDSFFPFTGTPKDPLDHWHHLPATVRPDPLMAGIQIMTFNLTDGGRGDDDLAANGRIVARGAPGDDLATGLFIQGTKFHDADGDGVNDGPFLGEVPLAGWTIYFDENQNGQLDATEPRSVTDAFGFYRFVDDDALPPGAFVLGADDLGRPTTFVSLERRTYVVAEVPQPGWVNTAPARLGEDVIDLGGSPRSLATGDLNNDGLEDLVVVINNHLNYDVAVLINNGDGTFTPRDQFLIGGLPEAAAIADFNGDALLDLAVTLTGADVVSVFLAKASGGFKAPTTLGVGEEPYGIVAGDVNRDGFMDLLTANFISDDVSVLLGNGDGTFRPATSFAAGDGPVALVLGQFSTAFDGNLDLAVVNAVSDNLSTLLGTGAGGFTLLENVPLGGDVGVNVGVLATGSFNPIQDNLTDLAVALLGADAVAILLGTGNGLQLDHTIPVSDRPRSLTTFPLGDSAFHGLVVANEGAARLTLLEGQGDGSLRALGEHTLADQPFFVTSADVNGDGNVDLVTANRLAGSVSILLANPNAAQRARLGDDPSAYPLDFGNRSLFNGQIGGVVWLDENANGARQQRPDGSLEPGVFAATVFIDLDFDGQLDFFQEPSVPTNTDGAYRFPNLSPGVYHVRALVAQGYAVTSPASGLRLAPVQADQVRPFEDFGVSPPAQVRGVTWEDSDGDGVRDTSEPRLAGWTVYADVNGNGMLDLTIALSEPFTITDANGEYSLLLAGGTHVIREVLQPGWVQTYPRVAGHPPITVAQGQLFVNVNFGNQFSPGVIRGVVWSDVNGNGIRDDVGNDGFFDEPGQFGVTVYLDDNENGQRDQDEPAQVTGVGGNYAFASLSADRTYVVAEEIPAGLAQTAPGFGAGQVHRITLATGQTVVANFGNTAEAIIRGVKFLDVSNDGLPGLLEPRLSGAFFVDLNRNSRHDAGEPFDSTDAQGNYEIRGLPPGSYAVMDAADVATLRDPHVDLGRYFGFALAVSGASIIVGDPRALRMVESGFPEFMIPRERGRVYVFGRDDHQFIHELIDPDPTPEVPTEQIVDAFGFSLAAAGGLAAVGAPLEVGPLGLQGMAFLFNLTTGQRIREHSHSGRDGTSVAILGSDYLVVGDPDTNGSPGSPGAVRLLALRQGQDDLHGKSSFIGAQTDFGESLAIVGNSLLLVGDPTENFPGEASGAAYLFDPRRQAAFEILFPRSFAHPTGQAHANFGAAVAGLGANVLIGAPGDNADGDESGAVYLFDGANSNRLRTFLNPTPAPGDHFGFAIAVVGDKVLIGAPGDDTLAENAGAAYLFDSATGELLQTFFSTTPFADAGFGFSLAAVDEHRIVVGAPSPDLILEPGAAYVFAIPNRVTITTPGQVETLHFPHVEDDDADGVANQREGPGDVNGDGIPDAQQANVATLSNVIFVAPSSTSFVDLRSVPNPSPADMPGDTGFPSGFFEFTLAGVPLGGAVTLHLIPPSGFQVNSYYKFGHEQPGDQPHWYPWIYQGVGTTGAEVFQNRIVLHFIDGQRGDDDLTANGVIVDPGGPAFMRPATITSVVLNDGAAQRSRINRLTVTFSGVVTLDRGVFQLTRSQGGSVKLAVASSVVAGQTVATITFQGSGISGSSLADGQYQLKVQNAKVRDSLGRTFDGDADGTAGGKFTYRFHRRFGDHDGDGDVDQLDLRNFLDSRSRDADAWWLFDYDGDGKLTQRDQRQFYLRLPGQYR